VKSPPVVAETLDGEATIVDLESGTYYALNESGTLIWDQLIRGNSVDSVVEELSAHYGIEPESSREAVTELARELLERDLIAPLGEGDSAPPQAANGAARNGSANGSAPSFTPPKLSTYTDMQELLLLDPVHEVDEAGWPHPPA
jgi:hypothetical protein